MEEEKERLSEIDGVVDAKEQMLKQVGERESGGLGETNGKTAGQEKATEGEEKVEVVVDMQKQLGQPLLQPSSPLSSSMNQNEAGASTITETLPGYDYDDDKFKAAFEKQKREKVESIEKGRRITLEEGKVEVVVDMQEQLGQPLLQPSSPLSPSTDQNEAGASTITETTPGYDYDDEEFRAAFEKLKQEKSESIEKEKQIILRMMQDYSHRCPRLATDEEKNTLTRTVVGSLVARERVFQSELQTQLAKLKSAIEEDTAFSILDARMETISLEEKIKIVRVALNCIDKFVDSVNESRSKAAPMPAQQRTEAVSVTVVPPVVGIPRPSDRRLADYVQGRVTEDLLITSKGKGRKVQVTEDIAD
eukprot:3468079-Rhodomonas_salina.1